MPTFTLYPPQVASASPWSYRRRPLQPLVHISKIKSIIIDVEDRVLIVEGGYEKLELISLTLVKFIYHQTSHSTNHGKSTIVVCQLAKHIIVSNQIFRGKFTCVKMCFQRKLLLLRFQLYKEKMGFRKMIQRHINNSSRS